MASSIVTGSCFCGAVKFEIELPTLFCGHCHCSIECYFIGGSPLIGAYPTAGPERRFIGAFPTWRRGVLNAYF